VKTFNDSSTEHSTNTHGEAVSEDDIREMVAERGSMTLEQLRTEIKRKLQGRNGSDGEQRTGEAVRTEDAQDGREPRKTPDREVEELQERISLVENQLEGVGDMEDEVGQLKGRLEELSERERELESATTGELQSQVRQLEARLEDLEVGSVKADAGHSFDVASIKSRLAGLEDQVRPEDIQKIRKKVRSLEKRLGDSRDYTQFKQRLEDAVNDIDNRKPDHSEMEDRLEHITSRMEEEMDAVNSNLQDDIERVREEIRTQVDDEVAELEGSVERNANRTEALKSEVESDLEPELRALRQKYEDLSTVEQEMESMKAEMESMKSEMERHQKGLRNEFEGRMEEVNARVSDSQTGNVEHREKTLQRLERVQDQIEAIDKDVEERPAPIPEQQEPETEIDEIEQVREEMKELREKVEQSSDPAPSAMTQPGPGVTIVD